LAVVTADGDQIDLAAHLENLAVLVVVVVVIDRNVEGLMVRLLLEVLSLFCIGP